MTEIKKINLIKQLSELTSEDKKNCKVLINRESQSIDIKKLEEKEFTSYFLEDVRFEVILWKVDYYKKKGVKFDNVNNLHLLLSKIPISKNAIEWDSNWKHKDYVGVKLGFRIEPIKTIEEWFLEGKLSEQEKQKALLAESKGWGYGSGVCISEKFYCSYRWLNYLVGGGEQLQSETLIELPPKK